MYAHVYDVALCDNTGKIWLLVTNWLATPAIAIKCTAYQLLPQT